MQPDRPPIDLMAALRASLDQARRARETRRLMTDQTPTPVLPDSMVERVTAAIRERLDDLGDEGRDQEGTLDGSLWLDGLDAVAADLARTAIAAALEGCEVREEWAVEVDKGAGFQLRPHPSVAFFASSRAEILGYYQGIVKPKRVVRRYVVTTPAVPATPEEPQP